jgi:hypothetical protein
MAAKVNAWLSLLVLSACAVWAKVGCDARRPSARASAAVVVFTIFVGMELLLFLLVA